MQFSDRDTRQDEIIGANKDSLRELAWYYEAEARQLSNELSRERRDVEHYREEGRQEGRQEILALPLYKLLWKWIKKYI